MSLNTDALRLFVLAAELLNISAAGRRLGWVPAVSSAKLAKLEQHLGAELLHRTTRKVSLSLEGADFCPLPARSSRKRMQQWPPWVSKRQRSGAR